MNRKGLCGWNIPQMTKGHRKLATFPILIHNVKKNARYILKALALPALWKVNTNCVTSTTIWGLKFLIFS